MPDELKSALEIALEKIQEQEETEVKKLTDEQREAISEIRKKYQARIAEAEINHQSRIRKAVESGAFDQIEKLKEQMVEEKRRLTAEMERKVEKARGSE